MRRLALTCSILGSLFAAGCVPSNATDSSEDRSSEATAPIVYGTADTAHTAVVALLIPDSGGFFGGCTGTVVEVKGTTAYVLTAAHCCNAGAPSLAVLATNYANYEQYVFGGNPPPPAYKVDATSVYYDSAYNGNTHDFCMLKVPGVPTTTAKIPVALPGNDGVTTGTSLKLGDTLEHVGYGQTEQDVQNPNSPNQNTSRRHASNVANVTVNSTIIQYTQGGPNLAAGTPGPCHGDSGGPTLVPSGAAQGTQKVVGVTSYGTGSGECIGSGAEGVSVRVTSVTGPTGFVTNYLNDTPSGTQAGSNPPATCDSCQQTALSSGACASTYNACANNNACNTLLTCLGNCTTQTCGQNCWTAAGTTGQTLYTNIINCICDTGCQSECASDPLCAQAQGCGLQSADASCNTCLEGSCCAQATACANNTTCLNCVTTSPTPAGCATNTLAKNFNNCLANNCATPCGISSSSSSSSSGSTSSSSSSSSSGSTSSSSSSSAASSGMIGTGGGGVGGGGVGGGTGNGGAPTGTTTTTTTAAGGSGNDPENDSGCSVSGEGAGSDPTKGGSIALLIGAAIAFVRRRKSA